MRRAGLLAATAVVGVIAGLVVVRSISARRAAVGQPIRQALFDELKPVTLANCRLQRFGEPKDGGYLLCANLLDNVQVAYSYGINGYDKWGCDVSRAKQIPVHEYDCFNTSPPSCPGAQAVFHAECVGPRTDIQENRRYDTVQEQLRANGDDGRHLVMKMDVEGAEWDTILSAPDSVLNQIDQLDVEFHTNDQPRFVSAVQKLKRYFYVAHVHFNNEACVSDQPPFPAWAYEVLFVNKSLARPGGRGEAPDGAALDARNNPDLPDCHPATW